MAKIRPYGFSGFRGPFGGGPNTRSNLPNGYGGTRAYQQAEAQRRIAERKYYDLLSRIIHDITGIIKRAKTDTEITDGIEAYANSGQFAALADSIVKRMVTGALVGQRATWRAAAAESTKGRIIFEELRKETDKTALGLEIDKIIDRNSYLIKTVPHSVAEKLSKLAYEQWMKGVRHEQIAEKMASMAPNLTQVQIKRIARTESAKAQSALMQARCESIGLNYYIWYSCNDERVRDAHAYMTGVLCRWDDPPNPEKIFGGHDSGTGYHPGGIYNCRCIALPVIDESDITFPIKFHHHGKITNVNNMNELRRIA